MLYFKVAMFLQFYIRDLGQVCGYFNLLHQTMLVVCPLQSIIIDYLIAEARRMGMPAASIADISDGESRSAKFKLFVWCLAQPIKNMNIFQLTPQIKAF